MRNVYTPTELNREARIHLEAGFGRIWVEGEISNLARPASGHLYFSVKDEKAQLRCALFRSQARNIGFRPENGQLVQVQGRLSVYEPRGDYQLIAEHMEAAGEGKLRAAFEALKRSLQKEGLFEQAHKQALPKAPQHIAVITSPSGAVIRDILQVVQRRWPLSQVRLYPVPVQGDEAAPAIVRALDAANAHGWAEVIVLARGGGSLEDLWPFNEEQVARAIHRSGRPVISAVGHETDVSISDFVADVRAPTPSAAAELLTPDGAALKKTLNSMQSQTSRAMATLLQRKSQRVDELSGRLQRQHPNRRITVQLERLDTLRTRLGVAMKRRVGDARQGLNQPRHRLHHHVLSFIPERRNPLEALARTLHAVSPLPTMARGYSVTLSNRKTVRSIGDVQAGDSLLTRLPDGVVTSVVEHIAEDPLPDDFLTEPAQKD